MRCASGSIGCLLFSLRGLNVTCVNAWHSALDEAELKLARSGDVWSSDGEFFVFFLNLASFPQSERVLDECRFIRFESIWRKEHDCHRTRADLAPGNRELPSRKLDAHFLQHDGTVKFGVRG